MIPLITREHSRALDQDAVQRLALPSAILMENAGRGACDAIVERFGECLSNVVVVGGTGQNGGDGWVVARQLVTAGIMPSAVLVGARAKVTGDALPNLRTLEHLGVRTSVVDGSDLSGLDAALGRATLIVDALFGTGLDRPIEGTRAAAIEQINASRAKVVALDLPSGVDADSGAILGCSVRADLTVTFAAHKRGLHQFPARAHVGELRCVSIGVPGSQRSDTNLIEAKDVARWTPERAADAHKGSAGHVLVVAGSAGRTGACLLSGRGALRGGAGLCTLASRDAAALDAKVVEMMTAALPSQPEKALEVLQALALAKRSAVVGPGLGLDPEGRALGRLLAERLDLPCVLDADALTALGTDLGCLRTAPAARVLTPHPGEAGRLLGCETSQVQADRYGAALRMATASGQLVVLKGAGTVIAAPDGRLLVCAFGTPALGTAGAGDVLAGAIAARLGEGDSLQAVGAAVANHALAAERAATADRGLLASEVADAMPRVLAECRRASGLASLAATPTSS